MKKIKTVIMLLLLANVVAAQLNNSVVAGKIKGAGNSPLANATVSLYKEKDSSLVKSSITNNNGEYSFEKIAEGRFFVKASAVNFEEYYKPDIEITAANTLIKLDDILLEPKSTTLSGVTVTWKRPLVENKIDRMILNVEAAVTNSGSTALEILEKSPGITVDNDGNISLKGKQGVIVLIDGKQTFLGAQDLANMLRNMTAAQLDQIEIMSQPPAKYDASGNSGLINIKTKKSTQFGYNGSLSLNYIQGRLPKTSENINMNYRKGKINLFGSYTFTHWEGFNELSPQRYFGKSGNSFQSFFDQDSYIRFNYNTHTIRTGIDFFATKKTTFGIAANGTFLKSNGWSTSRSNIYNGSNQLVQYNEAFTTNEGPWQNVGFNINYKSILDKNGSELTADIDFLQYTYDTKQNSNNYNYDANGMLLVSSDPIYNPNPFLLKGFLPGIIDIVSGRIDFSKPLKKTGKFEAGLKSSYVNNDNDAQYSYFRSSSFVYDSSRSNHFIYVENINAAYINFNRQFKKWGIQTGLRMEHSRIKGNQVVKSQQFDSSYVQLFPTVYISYASDEKNNFVLSYGRRVERPNYQNMNPFQYFLDQYTYRQGNPFLRPQTTDNFELSYNFHGQLNLSLNYTLTNDIINTILKQDDSTKVTYSTWENISQRRNLGFSLSYNKQFAKWWRGSISSNIYNNRFRGIVNNAPLNVTASAFSFNLNNQLTFKKGWSGEVSGFYYSKMLTAGLIVAEPMGLFSLGVGKQILKQKGNIRLSLIDIFWLHYFRGYTRFENIDTHITNKWDNRRVSLTFSYRFSKGKNQLQTRRRTSSAQEEQNRVGGQTSN